ncbi:MAG: LacI family DNA-binding transcriptional regulator [Lachnospiraceae bacterium]|nr:LacI family DNA-binding transcriptional regulator [Lachnospiraceae bacterium]
MVGIRDVAKYAGVSPSTVSRALSGVAFVEPQTKERVLEAVSALNYKPNLAARSLKKGSTKLIGLIIPDVTNPYYPEIVKCMETYASLAGYSMILCDALGSVEKEQYYMETLQHLFVDGILYIASTESIDHIKPYVGTVPMVVVNRTFDLDVPCVNIDNVDATYQVTNYLLKNGHRDIALLINDKDRQYNKERLEGVEKALQEYGLEQREDLIIRNVKDEEDIRERTKKLLSRKDRPSAIFAFNDYMVFAVYKAVYELNMTIPGDVSIAGFDDIPFVKYLNPSLTTIRHSLQDSAESVFEKLEEQMKTAKCAGRSVTYNKGRLVVRDSVKKLGV